MLKSFAARVAHGALVKTSVLVCSLALSVSASATEITGAGSSFVAPIFAKWADAYHKATGIKMNYQSIGSAGGIKQIRAKTVDFGASDKPLTPEELQKDGLMQFPVVIGGVVPVVNISGVKAGDLKLSGQVLAAIYLGKITKWNDPAIIALNPGLKLPDQLISAVRRADGSGTSYIFTNYLSKVSDEWKTKVGEGTAVQWPVGTGGKGNEGVSAFVQQLPGSIGYVEYAYAKQNKLAHIQLKNADGQFVAPDDVNFKAAAAAATWQRNSFYEVLTNQPGKNAWPLTGATFVLMHTLQDKPVNGGNVLSFFSWVYKNGDAMATELDYVPMPDNVNQLVVEAWKNVKDASGKAVVAK